MRKQIKSKERVRDHAEVFTAPKEVNNMLDLVASSIDGTFLEPSFGEGNFLVEILRRKLRNIARDNWQDNSMKAFQTMYGVELLDDNIKITKNRLWKLYKRYHKVIMNSYPPDDLEVVIKYIMSLNLVQGDFLTARNNHGDLITFIDWKDMSKHTLSTDIQSVLL